MERTTSELCPVKPSDKYGEVPGVGAPFVRVQYLFGWAILGEPCFEKHTLKHQQGYIHEEKTEIHK